MSSGGFSKRHLCRDRAGVTVPTVTATLPVFFEERSESRLRYAEMRCRERFPNLSAASPSSGVIPAGLDVSDQILLPRLSPYLRLFARIPVERVSTL